MVAARGLATNANAMQNAFLVPTSGWGRTGRASQPGAQKRGGRAARIQPTTSLPHNLLAAGVRFKGEQLGKAKLGIQPNASLGSFIFVMVHVCRVVRRRPAVQFHARRHANCRQANGAEAKALRVGKGVSELLALGHSRRCRRWCRSCWLVSPRRIAPNSGHRIETGARREGRVVHAHTGHHSTRCRHPQPGTTSSSHTAPRSAASLCMRGCWVLPRIRGW